ncbi:MAG: phospholipid-binding protein MlaC [Gammaproteobacteria bacterium]
MIRRALTLLLLPLTLLLASMAPEAAVATKAASALPPPHQVVEKATREVLDRIVRDRPVFRKDPAHLNLIIEENLVPYVDFDRIARRIMAKHFQQATPAQRGRFQQVFKDSLIRAYGTALADYNDQRFVVLPPGRGDVEADRATVRMEVTLSDGKVYPISYSMFLDGKGAWKLENLVLNGINLGLTYRNNFADLMQQHRGDIDKVIQAWSSTVDKDDGKAG